MTVLLEQDLKKNIESGNFARCYLLFGNDDGLKRLYSSTLIKKTAGEDSCFNLQQFSGDCDLQSVFDAAQQFPMMNPLKCVTLCDFDFEKCGDNNFSKLQTLIADLPDTTVLVLWFDTVEIDEKKSARFKKLVSACEKAGGMAVRLDHRSSTDLVRMLCAAASRGGSKMETSTARYLIETCSADYNILKNEISKLIAFAGDRLITKDMVDRVCVRSVEASVYNISRELAAKNLGRSIKLLDELLFLKIKPPVILSVLSSAFVEMYIGKTASCAGIKPARAAADFGYKNREFVITRAVDNARRLDERTIGLCLGEILNADARIKSSTADGRVVLEEMMVKIVYIMSEGRTIDKA